MIFLMKYKSRIWPLYTMYLLKEKNKNKAREKNKEIFFFSGIRVTMSGLSKLQKTSYSTCWHFRTSEGNITNFEN